MVGRPIVVQNHVFLFAPYCPCFSEETLKAVGPIYAREVNDPTWGNGKKPVEDSHSW